MDNLDIAVLLNTWIEDMQFPQITESFTIDDEYKFSLFS